jgi:hypothetical protein
MVNRGFALGQGALVDVAARSGAKVIPVERFTVTGGDLTVGGVLNMAGSMGSCWLSEEEPNDADWH